MKYSYRGHRASLAAMAFLVAVSAVLPTPAQAQLAAGTGRFIGNALDIAVRPDYKVYWNQVTPGNAGKWGSVEGVQDNYSWTALDTYYNYAMDNGLPFKDHTLVWGNQQPGWISSLDSAGQRAQVEEWIKLVGQRYPSMSMVDVVNEPFHAVPSYAPAIGGTGKTGWDWIVQSFTWARQYCMKGVKLILNEYNVLHDNTVTTTYLRLIDTLRVRNLIDAIGIQGHYFEFRATAAAGGYVYNVATIKANLERLVATGLPVYISEFDINEPVDSIQLANYQTYFPIFWDNPGVKGITLWGYVQGDMWQVNGYLLRADGSERPAMQWLRTYVASPLSPTLIAPISGSGYPVNPILTWTSSARAKRYRMQISTNTGFSTVAMDTTVVDTVVRARQLVSSTRHYWRVTAMNDSGAGAWSATGAFQTGTEVAAVGDAPTIALSTTLHQNYPNPFNPSTRIMITVGERQLTSVNVYDVLGREVATLMHEVKEPGVYTLTFDGTSLAGGMYYCRMQCGAAAQTRTMALVK
jgi:endo-1,4-beta-xylanase